METKLETIRAELKNRRGDLRRISRECGLTYDTVLRIKNSEGDPGFTKAELLAKYLGFELEFTKKV